MRFRVGLRGGFGRSKLSNLVPGQYLHGGGCRLPRDLLRRYFSFCFLHRVVDGLDRIG